MWEDQRIVARPRYRELIEALRFVARQELIFGMHVHVGLDDPEKAIHVANGMRVHVAVLLALSANSPFWRGRRDGPACRRARRSSAPFPRVGDPADVRRLGRLRAADRASWSSPGVMEDYTYLWYDVRPHPKLGTVEIRVCDSQTRVEHTLGLAALIQAMVKELAEHFDARRAARATTRGRCSTRTSGSPRATASTASSSTCRATSACRRKELARRLLDRLREHAQDLGCGRRLRGVEDLLARGNGAHRQRVVYEANHDLREVMAEIVEATVPALRLER